MRLKEAPLRSRLRAELPHPFDQSRPYRAFNIGNNKPLNLIRYIEVLKKCPRQEIDLEPLVHKPTDVPARVRTSPTFRRH